MKFRTTVSALSVAVALSVLSGLFAAPPKTEPPTKNPPPGKPAATTAGQSSDRQGNDHMVASCVAIDNQAEIAIARFIEDKTKNDDVKKFARMLIKDHGGFLQKLEKFAPEATQDGYLDRGNATAGIDRPQRIGEVTEKGLAKPNIVTRVAAKPPLDGGNQEGIDPVALGREIAQQCLADTEAMLSKKSGDKFDECFVGMQIAKHAEMKSKLAVLQRHSSGELAQLLAMGAKTTQAHLDHAEKLMQQLADADRGGKTKEK